MDITTSQFEEWIRQNFFGEFSDSDFAKQISNAKETYIRVKTYLAEHDLEFSLESLNAVKDLIMDNEEPPAEVKDKYGEKTPAPVPVKADVADRRPIVPVTLESIDERIEGIEKKAMWALIALLIILFIK